MDEQKMGSLHATDARTALHFERTLNHTVDRVWRALTERDDLERWYPGAFTFEPRIGGGVDYGQHAPAGAVTAYDPAALLGLTWGDDRVVWEVIATTTGCVLRLTHLFEDRFKAARDAAGWHLCLDRLEALLDRRPNGAGESGATSEDWDELNNAYEALFGIDHALATGAR